MLTGFDDPVTSVPKPAKRSRALCLRFPLPYRDAPSGVIAAALINSPWLTALPPFLVAGAVCMVAVPGIDVARPPHRAVAEPDGDRHLHVHTRPRDSAASRCLPCSGSPSRSSDRTFPDRWQVLAVTGAITIAMAIDDILDLSWRSKLAIEIGVGVLTVLLGITITTLAGSGRSLHVGHRPPLAELPR